MKQLFKRTSDDSNDFWMSYTDLMSGLLVIFIILCVILYKHHNELKKQNASLTEIVDSLDRSDLKNLITEYEDVFIHDENIKVDFDIKRGSIVIRHKDAEKDLFAVGQYNMRDELKDYIDKIGKKIVEKTIFIWEKNQYNNVELRIEGHTDPTWTREISRGTNMSFINNLQLSSQRANSVYQYILQYTNLNIKQQDFVKKNMISIGYSFSSRVNSGTIHNAQEDASSRRIEFRIISK